MVRHLIDSRELEIVKASKDDIPAIADVTIDASAADLAFQIMSEGHDVRKGMVANLEAVWDSPQLWPLVAREKASGAILGSALFIWLDKPRNSIRQLWDASDGIAPLQGGDLATCSLLQAPFGFISRPSGDLGDDVREKMKQVQMEWLYGKNCSFLASLMVRSSAQRGGIGSRLLQAGLDRSDSEGKACFLIASPFGHPLYSHREFKMVDVIDHDLSDWTGSDMGYGLYRSTVMVRLPSLKNES